MVERVKMINKRFTGGANVLPDDVPVWEAQGWTVAPNPKPSSKKAKDE